MNTSRSTYILIPLLLLFSACAFNKRFHRPDKIPFETYAFPSYDYGGDTTYISFDTIDRSILLRDAKLDTINSQYAIQSVRFGSTSGNQLEGWWMSPKDQEPLATVLHFHGSAQNLLAQYQSIAPLVHSGYEVFTFDYSGYGLSQGEATRENALLDAFSALSYVDSLRENQDKKLILYGESYGGYLAAVVGSNRQDQIDGIVIEGAFSSHRKEAKFESPFWGNLVKNDAIAAKELTKNTHPLLVVHSTDDQRVPLAFGKDIFKGSSGPKEFLEINGGHCLGLTLFLDEILHKMEVLFK